MSELTIQIGETARTCRLYTTEAPPTYDGFGTLTVDEYSGCRA